MDQFPYEFDLQRELRIKKIKENYDKVMSSQEFIHPYKSAESILKNIDDYDYTNKQRRLQRIQKSDYFKNSILDRVSYGLGGQGKTQQLIEEITQKQVQDIANGKVSSPIQKQKSQQNLQKIMSLKYDIEKANFPYLQKMYQPYDPFYNPTRGFIIHFDNLTPISAKVKQLKLSYSVFYQGGKIVNQQNQFKPFEKEFLMEKHCDIQKREIFMRINPDPRIVLYIELELFTKQYRQKPDIIAWTILKLFDDKDKLLQGRYQLPFYSQQSDTIKLLLEKPDPQMQILEDTKLNLRLCVPFDPELDNNEDFDKVYVKNQEDYKIPALHQENIHQSIVDNAKLFNYDTELRFIRNQHLKPWDLDQIAEEDFQELQKRNFSLDPKDNFLHSYQETQTNNLYYKRYKINNDLQDMKEDEELLNSLLGIGNTKKPKKNQNQKDNKDNKNDMSFEKLLDDEELKEDNNQKSSKKNIFNKESNKALGMALQGIIQDQMIYDDKNWINIVVQDINQVQFKSNNDIKYKLWFEKDNKTLIYTKNNMEIASIQGLLQPQSLKKQILKVSQQDFFYITEYHLFQINKINLSKQIFLNFSIILPKGEEYTGKINIIKNEKNGNKVQQIIQNQLLQIELQSNESEQKCIANLQFQSIKPFFLEKDYSDSKKLMVEIKEITQYPLQENIIFKISLISDKGYLKTLEQGKIIEQWCQSLSNAPNTKKKIVNFPENSKNLILEIPPLDYIKDTNPTNTLNIHILFEFYKLNQQITEIDNNTAISNLNKQELGWFVRPLYKNKKIEFNKVKNAKDILYEYPAQKQFPFNMKIISKTKIKFQYSVQEI